MKNAVVFSGRNGLDFMDLRLGVLRIPEVTIRIREAQKIMDAIPELPKVDLLATIGADDEHFFRNIKLKSLASAIVQIGLYDRYLKTQKAPAFMVGNSNGDSAMMVCSGLMTMKELVEQSAALGTLRPAEKVVSLVTEAMPLLSGLSLTEYQALRLGGQGYEKMEGNGQMELRKLVATLHLEHGVECFVNIGPASALRGTDYRNVGAGDLESLDSIELDPLLGWFWKSVRPQAFALAQ